LILRGAKIRGDFRFSFCEFDQNMTDFDWFLTKTWPEIASFMLIFKLD